MNNIITLSDLRMKGSGMPSGLENNLGFGYNPSQTSEEPVEAPLEKSEKKENSNDNPVDEIEINV